MGDRLVYWGTCDKCLTTMTLSPHPERGPLPLPNDEEEYWDSEKPYCPVCGNGTIDLGNSDLLEGFRL